MKANRYTFQWFKKEDRRKALRASVSREGKLRLGRPLRKALPPFIRVGFDRDARVLAIAEGRELDGDAAAAGSLNARLLSAQICSIGLKLPIAFSLRRDEATGFYLGTVIPRRQRDAATGQRHYDPEQLLTLYTPMIDRSVAHLAKSTPLAERKAIAAEALCAALPAYRPAMGSAAAFSLKTASTPMSTATALWTSPLPPMFITPSPSTTPSLPPPAASMNWRNASWPSSSAKACPPKSRPCSKCSRMAAPSKRSP